MRHSHDGGAEPRGMATGSYVDERDDWPVAVARAAREGWRWLELTAINSERFDALDPFFADGGLDALAPFERVSLHAPVQIDDVDATLRHIAALPLEADVVLHPDWYADAEAVATLGSRALFENMDVAKKFGHTPDDLAPVFERFPDAGFCFDVAHVWTNDTSLALGHGLLDAFEPRLRQLHVSGIEADGTHRTTTRADLELYRPLLDRCGHVPWLLEAELES